MRRTLPLLPLLCGAVAAWVPSPQSPRIESMELRERKFAQPMTANKIKKKRTTPKEKSPVLKGDNTILVENHNRVRNSGKVGSKKYVDPCKVFVGNLPFETTSEDLRDWVLGHMKQSPMLLQDVKVIRDWKTNKSKGYGFCLFLEPIYATVCMDACNGKPLGGRNVSVAQGKKKEVDAPIRVKKKAAPPVDEEEAAIHEGMAMAESEEEEDCPTFSEDAELDAQLFGIVADEDDDESDIDGIYWERPPQYENVDWNLNRKDRREQQRRLKKQKISGKGFG